MARGMARSDGLYSRVVAWLKILLPLAALALLSTIFLFSRSAEDMIDARLDALTREGGTLREEIRAPFYSGTTPRGDVLTLRADHARPDGQDQIRAEDLQALMRLSDGSQITLQAVTALVRDRAGEVRLQGGVEIDSSTGYALQTEGLTSAIDRISAETDGPVAGTGPVGEITAGRLRIAPVGTEGDVQLLFTDGVKLIYHPQD